MMNRNVSLIVLLILIITIAGIGGAGASTTLTVPSNPLWTNTGLHITSGQTISITASGTWNTGLGACGPDGDNSGNTGDLFLTSTAPSKHGELIAYVGTASNPDQGHLGDGSFFPKQVGEGYWAIGSNAVFTADRSGELWLGINDDAISQAVGDNTGMLVTITAVTGIPEFPTVAVPVAAILGLVVIFGRRRNMVQ